jgi:hypothetical protein
MSPLSLLCPGIIYSDKNKIELIVPLEFNPTVPIYSDVFQAFGWDWFAFAAFFFLVNFFIRSGMY